MTFAVRDNLIPLAIAVGLGLTTTYYTFKPSIEKARAEANNEINTEKIAEDSTKIWSEAASESHNAAKATFQSHNESASGVKNPINSHSNTDRSADTAMTKKWSAFYNSHA